MNECYLCGKVLENHVSDSTSNHDEHIIPQALGGQLKARGLLCKDCGGEKFLGGKIDKPFSDLFKLITARLEIMHHRITNPVALKGKLRVLRTGHVIDVHLKGGKVSHQKPEYKINRKEKTVKIFANKVVAKDYRKKVEQELRNTEKDWKKYSIVVISDLLSHEEFQGVLELPFNIDNNVFEAGFTKIALEFAISRGISLNAVAHLIDRNARALNSLGTLLPYYPIREVEKSIEYLRTSLDQNFMSHSLVLFSQRQVNDEGAETKQLYCFIELFGTFQYFVKLNDNYVGENIEPIAYSQRIIYNPETDESADHLSPKDMSIYLSEMGVPLTAVADKSDDEIRWMIDRFINRNRYVFDYAGNIKAIVDRILRDTILANSKSMLKVIPEFIGHFYRNPDTDDFHVTFFRSRYRVGNRAYSIIPKIIELHETDRKKFHEYTFFKFDELEAFIIENNKKRNDEKSVESQRQKPSMYGPEPN